jgi:hypothetical protein
MAAFERGSLRAGLAAFLICASGCYHYRPIAPSEAGRYEEIRVTYTRGSVEELLSPDVAADTLHAVRKYDRGAIDVPLDQVAEAEGRTFNAGGTALLGLAVGAAVGVLTLLVVIAATVD